MSARSKVGVEEACVLETSPSTPVHDSPPHTPLLEESSEHNVSESADATVLRCKVKAMQEEIVALRDVLQRKEEEKLEEEQQESSQQERRRYMTSDKLVAHKYVELLKKLRNQNVQLYVAQNQVQKLRREVEALKKEKETAESNSRIRKNQNKQEATKKIESNESKVSNKSKSDDDEDENNYNNNNNGNNSEKDKERVERLHRQLHRVTMDNDLLKRQNNELVEVIKDEVGFGANYTKEKILQWVRRHGNRACTTQSNCDDDDDNNSNTVDSNEHNSNIGDKGNYIRGWKGRAAQIVLLQSKVKDYERELRALKSSHAHQGVLNKVSSEKGTNKSDDIDNEFQEQEEQNYNNNNNSSSKCSSDTNDRSVQQIGKEVDWNKEEQFDGVLDKQTNHSRTVDFDDRTREKLAQIHGNKLAALRDVEAQVAQLKDELAQEKNNGKAYQARFSNLQHECVQLRNYVKTLLDKSKSDDTLIDAYKSEIKLLQSSLYKAKDEVAFYATTVADKQRDHNDVTTLSDNDALAKKANSHSPSLPSNYEEQEEQEHSVKALRVANAAQSPTSSVMISEGDALLLRWVHKLLEIDPTVQLTIHNNKDSNNNNIKNSHNSAMQKVVWIAHAHVLRLEEQIQSTYHIILNNLINRINELIEQMSKVNKTTSDAVGKEVKVKLIPSVDKFILTENKQLKERIRSLVELNRAEGKVFETSNC